ncbi:MAG: NUDIX domain-containing protein [Hyphomicrobium sp.]|nr:NUDIX domain-containing protein [Hyphomicrobium sp.]
MGHVSLITRLFQAYWRWTRTVTLGVAAIVLDRDGRVLLVQRRDEPIWRMPMGRSPKSETASEALARVLAQDFGLIPDGAPELFALYRSVSEPTVDHVALFVVRGTTGTIRPAHGTAHAYFAPDALPPDTHPAVAARLSELARGTADSESW